MSELAVLPGYDADNLDIVEIGEAEYAPGTTVVIGDEHDIYPGETGIVQAVGKNELAGPGLIYDILIEGTSDAERFSEDDIAGDA